MPRGIPGSGPKPKAKTTPVRRVKRKDPGITATECNAVTPAHLVAEVIDEISGAVGQSLEIVGRVETFNQYPMRPEVFVRIITVTLECALEQSAAGFKERPSAERFGELEDAMYAWQYWRGCGDTEKLELIVKLRDIGVMHWPKAVRTAQDLNFKKHRQGL